MSNVSLGRIEIQVSLHRAANENAQKGGLAEKTEQAAGAISGYMHQNGMDSLDTNKLMEMAFNKGGQVPDEVRNAAIFMLAHPKVFEKIETHDTPGSDGKSSVKNFEQAAQGNIPVGGPSGAGAPSAGAGSFEPEAGIEDQAQKAAGALGAFLHDKGAKGVDANGLYAMAINARGDVPEEVQQAAAFMLKHPKIYEQIETADKAGADGKSGVGNFDKAAQGLVPLGAGKGPEAEGPSMSAKDILRALLEQLGIKMEPKADAGAGAGAGGGADAGAGMGAGGAGGAEKAAGALAAYMHDKGIGSVNPNKLYELARNESGQVPPEVQEAATFMLKHPKIYEKIETTDVAGADGKSGVGNFDKAAQGLVPMQQGNGPQASKGGPDIEEMLRAVLEQLGLGKDPKAAPGGPGLSDDAQKAAGALAAFMHDKQGHVLEPRSINVNDLYAMANDKSGKVPPAVQEAAEFMLKHPQVYEKIETADKAGADGKSGVGNLEKAAQGLL